ncbi:MAG: GerAB/ArcD/ProY family transporter [Betaproteobacteria bacterium]
MAQPRISGFQFVTLAFWYTIGTSTLLLPSNYARQDTWLSILIAAAAGLLAIAVWFSLGRRFPGKTPFGYAKDVLGPVFGTLIGVVYFLYFTHLSSLVLRNVMEMYATSILTRTPPVVFVGTMVLLSAWLVRAGLEPLARMGDLLVPFLGVGMPVLIALAFATPGLTHVEFLLPVLERGVIPVLRQALCLLAFPFGELVVFLFIAPATAHPERAGKLLAVATVAGAAALVFVFISNLLAVGPNELVRLSFPSLTTIREIQLGQFLQRIEVLGILQWTAGSFVKLAVTHYAAVLGAAELFSLEDPRPMAVPLAFSIAVLCITEYSNLPEMVEFAARAFPIYAPVVQIGLPLVMLVASWLRGRAAKQGSGATGASGAEHSPRSGTVR